MSNVIVLGSSNSSASEQIAREDRAARPQGPEQLIEQWQDGRWIYRCTGCAAIVPARLGMPEAHTCAPAAIAVPEPRPANSYETAGRIKKLARFIARLDKFAGHQVTAAEVEAANPAMIAAMLAGESRKPSDATVAALADALLAREAK